MAGGRKNDLLQQGWRRGKLGRWFSWNASACKQLREFYASKMLLEAHLDHSVPDPDEDAVAFDNLEAAAQARTPREELAKLRATVGGLRLAYKLMSAKLHMTARVMYVAIQFGRCMRQEA